MQAAAAAAGDPIIMIKPNTPDIDNLMGLFQQAYPGSVVRDMNESDATPRNPRTFVDLCNRQVGQEFIAQSRQRADIIVESHDDAGSGDIRSFIYINILNNDDRVPDKGKVFYIDLICRGQQSSMGFRDQHDYGQKAIPLIKGLQEVCKNSRGSYIGIKLSALEHVQGLYANKLLFVPRAHGPDGRSLPRWTSEMEDSGIPMSWYVHPRQEGGKKSRKTRKWSNLAPKPGKHRTRMLKKCGKKCFLASKKRFPICAKGTCKVNKKGLKAAYMRARSTGARSRKLKRKMAPIARRAKKMLRKFKN